MTNTKTPEELAEEYCNNHTCHLQMRCHAEAFLAGYSAATPKWISVEERLPEESGSYLCVRFEGDLGSTLDYNIKHKGWNIGFDGDRKSEIFPTHWQPLPKPPGDK